MTRWLIGGGAAALLAIGGAAIALQNESAAPVPTAEPSPSPTASASPRRPAASPTAMPQDAPIARGETPMAERVAVLGLLNKRNGISRDLTMKPGQALRVGDVIVRLRACERTAPWEVQKLTGAFVQVDVRGADTKWRRAFSGWLYKESPSLNVVEHPIYDVWPKSCTMTHPEIGPGTLRASDPSSGGGAPARRSSAPKSGEAEPSPSVPEPADSAAPSDAT
jgi:hypothetical protein